MCDLLCIYIFLSEIYLLSSVVLLYYVHTIYFLI